MNNPKSLKEQVIKGSLVIMVLTFLGAVCAYLIRILYSHTLRVEDYGLFYAVFTLFNVATTYSDLGFGYSVIYLMPKSFKLKNYSKAWNILLYGQIISLITSIVSSIIFALSAPFLAKNYFKVPGSENLIYVFCIYLITFAVINGLIQVYSGMQKPKYYASITFSRWLLTLIFSIFFFLFDLPNIIFYAIAWAFGHILTVVIFLGLLHLNHSFLTRNKFVWDSKIFKHMFSFALPSFMETIIASTLIADTFFLTMFKGVREVGIYNIIYPLASIPIVLISPINSLLLPLVSHLMEGEKQKMEYLIRKILESIPFIGLYFALFIIILPSQAVGLVFGQKWQGLVEIPLTILAFGTLPMLLVGILGTIILGLGKVRERLKVSIVMTAISITFNALLIWYYGVVGAVITASIVALIIIILYIKIIRTQINVSIPFMLYLKLLVFSLTFYTLIKYFGISPRNIFEIIGFGILYTIIFISFGKMINLYDKRLFWLLAGKKVNN